MKAGIPFLSQRHDSVLPIGLQFGEESVRLAQCTPGPEGVQLSRACSEAYPCAREQLLSDPRQLRKFLNRVFAAGGFRGRAVHFSLAADEVRIVPLSVAGSGAEMELALVRSLREKLRSDLSGEVVDYVPVGDGATSGGGECNLIATMASRQAVSRYLELLDQAGLHPLSVDVEQLALVRLLSRIPAAARAPLMLLNLGSESSHIAAVSSGQLMLEREVQFGRRSLLTRLSEGLNVSPEVAHRLLMKRPNAADAAGSDAELKHVIEEILYPLFARLSEEVGRTLVYIASKTRGGSAGAIYLWGSLAGSAVVRHGVQKMFGGPVCQLEPGMAFPDKAGVTGPELAVACGLALRGAHEGH